MSKKKERKQSLTAEEKYQLSVHCKRLFKALVRLAYANRFWLTEVDDEEEQLGDNVLKNVRLITRKKGAKSPLTLREKAILNIPSDCRSDEDKHAINRAIGGLKCFRKYPLQVKSMLAAVTYYVYYGPGRVIVKQNHYPSAMYFILSGEVEVTQVNYDKILNENVTTNFGTMGAGTMFGEVALLLGIQRTATITTLTDCEMLKINKEDFEIVLKDTVAKAWDEVLQILRRFHYFDSWDDFTRRECCIMSRRKFFEPDEIIFGGGTGMLNYTYFVVQGSCYILEHLLLKTYYVNGVKKYKLYNPNNKNNKKEDESAIEVIKEPKTEESQNQKRRSILRASVEGSKKLTKKSSLSFKAEVTKEPETKEEKLKRLSTEVGNDKIRRRSVTSKGSEIIVEESPSISSQVMQQEIKTKVLNESTSKLGVQIIDDTDDLPPNVETHFIKVCDLQESACFNIGENFKRRHVIAKTKVDCLLIPGYWLLAKNKDNIWSRVRQYYDKHIPSSGKLFAEFQEQQKWKEYKKKLIKDIISKKKIVNTNTIHNVPYSIRIHDTRDLT